MEINQIYNIVNSVTRQAIGSEAITAVDAQGLISLGNQVLSSQTNTEAFLNTLAQRIGRTILSYRAYRNKLNDVVLNDFEYGAILQKIKVSMPSAESDESYNLVDGASVDMYKVNKPDVNQKLFVTETPYQFHITIQRITLKEAFLSEAGLSGFIGLIFGEVENAIELALENLARTCMANFMAESTHEIKLLTEYNALGGNAITAAQAYVDEKFLRFALSRMKLILNGFTDMTSIYNDGSETRHTPLTDIRIRVISNFQYALETSVQYAAFNDNYVKLDGYTVLNFWQSVESPNSINIKRASDGAETAINNIIAFIHDRDALGIYKKMQDTLTSPVNAAGSYYNVYWHEKQLWFNDLSENGVFFTLN